MGNRKRTKPGRMWTLLGTVVATLPALDSFLTNVLKIMESENPF